MIRFRTLGTLQSISAFKVAQQLSKHTVEGLFSQHIPYLLRNDLLDMWKFLNQRK